MAVFTSWAIRVLCVNRDILTVNVSGDFKTLVEFGINVELHLFKRCCRRWTYITVDKVLQIANTCYRCELRYLTAERSLHAWRASQWDTDSSEWSLSLPLRTWNAWCCTMQLWPVNWPFISLSESLHSSFAIFLGFHSSGMTGYTLWKIMLRDFPGWWKLMLL